MKIESYKELRVYQSAFELAMEIFEITKSFPSEEKFSMTDQIRRSSRSVCANIAEAWRKRRYMAAFISKINDSETEACETQVWIEFVNNCQYLTEQKSTELLERYDRLLGQLVIMIHDADKWVIMKKVSSFSPLAHHLSLCLLVTPLLFALSLLIIINPH